MIYSSDMLASIGRALYGERWQSPLADDLGIARETIRRWLSGHTHLPAEHVVFNDLAEILASRQISIGQAAHGLAAWRKENIKKSA
jgi:hypothetical protein